MEPLLDNAPAGFLSFDDSGTIISLNKTVEFVLEQPRESLIGQSIETIFTLANRIFYNTHLFPLLRLQGRADEIFLSLKTSKGSDIPVLANFAKREIRDDIFNYDCIFIVVQHRKKFEQELITAKRVAEDTSRQNEELVKLTTSLEERTKQYDTQMNTLASHSRDATQFSRIISHDLQEPIRKMSVFLDKYRVEESGNLNSKTADLISKIEGSLQRIRHLTSGLSQFIHVETEKHISTFNLSSVIEHARLQAIKRFQFSDFEVTVDSLPKINADKNQLELLFYYLLSNSIENRDLSRKLVVTIDTVVTEENLYQQLPDKYRYAEHVKINFTDNGQGFENIYKGYVFEMAKKLDSTSTGVGLGLSLSKRIVENHFGTIWIESTPKVGTTVSILLPLSI